MEKRIEMSIVVLTQNGWAITLRCLESICVSSRGSNVEIVLIDNGATDDMRFNLASALSQIEHTYVRLETNIGAAAGRNLGLAHARGSLIVFLDNDTTVESTFVKSILAYFELHPFRAAAQCKIMRARFPQQIENAGFTLDVFGLGYTAGYGETDSRQYDQDRDILGGVTSGFAVRASAMQSVSGFDSKMFYQFEDADLCWRLWKSGNRIGFCYSARVFHLNGGTIPRNPSYIRFYARNRIWSLARNLDGAFLIIGLFGNVVYCLMLAVVLLFSKGPRFSLAVLSGIVAGFSRLREIKQLRVDDGAIVKLGTRDLLSIGVLTRPSLRVLSNIRFLPRRNSSSPNI